MEKQNAMCHKQNTLDDVSSYMCINSNEFIIACMAIRTKVLKLSRNKIK